MFPIKYYLGQLKTVPRSSLFAASVMRTVTIDLRAREQQFSASRAHFSVHWSIGGSPQAEIPMQQTWSVTELGPRPRSLSQTVRPVCRPAEISSLWPAARATADRHHYFICKKQAKNAGFILNYLVAGSDYLLRIPGNCWQFDQNGYPSSSEGSAGATSG